MIILDPFVWKPERYIYSFDNELHLTYYGLSYMISFLVSIFLILKSKYIGVKKENIMVFVTFVAIGSMIGGRLGFILFYSNLDYWQNPIEIIKTWKGGISSHGAAIGMVCTLLSLKKYVEKPFLWLLDNVLMLSLFAGCLIRIGNFINSEKIGARTNSNWGVIFKNSIAFAPEPRHPTQLYESFFCATLFLIFCVNYKSNLKQNGYVSSVILISLFGFRYLIGYFFSDSITHTEQALNIWFALSGLVLFLITQLTDTTKTEHRPS
jgi:phosphatidylglycerol---prolipoprotein diacylglyceryl transferase